MRLLFDITTTIRTPFDPPVGTTRVERTILADLYEFLGRDQLTPVNYDGGRFVFLSRAEEAIVEAVVKSPEQRAPRPGHGPNASTSEAISAPAQDAAAYRPNLSLKQRLGHRYLDLYPEEARDRAYRAAVDLLQGVKDTLSVAPTIWRRAPSAKAVVAAKPSTNSASHRPLNHRLSTSPATRTS